MTYYHVRVSVKGQRHDEVKNDLSEENLDRQFLDPYRTARPITLNGKTLAWDSVERLRISASDESASQLIERIKIAERNSSVVTLGGPSYGWKAARRADDVTDQFITGPPGESAQMAEGKESGLRVPEAARSDGGAGDPDAVFVVSGRDWRAVSAVSDFLRALGLRIIEWEHAVAKTGLPNPYVGDVVEQGLRMAGAAVVLLTPDDLVQLRPDLAYDDDGVDERELRGQARPNVYYEAGIADAIGRERTILVEVGAVKPFSDAAGRHVVRYDGSPARRHAFAERLKVAGLSADTTGQAWLTAGDITAAVEATRASLATGATNRGRTEIDRSEVIRQLDSLLSLHADMRRQSLFDDLSDRPDESLDFVIRSSALIDRFAAGSAFAQEAARVESLSTHQRVPVHAAVLRALRDEVEGEKSRG